MPARRRSSWSLYLIRTRDGALYATQRGEVTKLRGEVELVAPGTLPNDGKVIEDARSYR